MNQEFFTARQLDCRLVHYFNALQCNPGFPYPIEPSVYSQEVYGKSLSLDKKYDIFSLTDVTLRSDAYINYI